VKYSRILSAMNSSTSGITTYTGLYPRRLTIIGHTLGGGGLAIIRSSRMALEKLCIRSATVNMIRPSVKFDEIFLYI